VRCSTTSEETVTAKNVAFIYAFWSSLASPTNSETRRATRPEEGVTVCSVRESGSLDMAAGFGEGSCKVDMGSGLSARGTGVKQGGD